ncbi:perilipin-2-like [Xenopus laevis]|uniref:Perilipin n=2 Tax=Xenopus laevis TaxID=8355 RepID=A0A974C4U2_XENLA|nr:perilipin-2-like [Xenopus laevis]OCT66655.1 hypothetical protein XELAEV_18042907mg [Xenopus laevis]
MRRKQPAMENAEEIQPETVAQRVARLPFIHSSFQIFSSAYHDVKDLNPLVSYLCRLSERGVNVASRVASAGASPVLSIMKPQIALVNSVALRVVDELQTQLPVLDQPADEVVAEFWDTLTGAAGAARDQVLNSLQEAQDRTNGLVTGAQGAALLAATTLGNLGIRESLELGAELLVSQAVKLVDTYLPEQEEEEEDEDEGEAGSGRGSSDEEGEESGGSAVGLISMIWLLLDTIIPSRLMRLDASVYSAWTILYGALNLGLSVPLKLKSQLQSLIRRLLFTKPSKEEPQFRASFKKKINHSSRLERSPRKRSKNEAVPVSRVSANGRRVISEFDDETPRVRYNRRQSLESAFYTSRILED